MDNSLFPSCYVASFSNILSYHGHAIDDDVLFGLSGSFDFLYSYVDLPLSGLTHSFTGTNFNAFVNLAHVFNIEYFIKTIQKDNYLRTLQEILDNYGCAIIEVSIKEYIGIYEQEQELDELLDTMGESNTNHVINVMKVDEKYAYIYDSFRLDLQKVEVNLLLKAAFPDSVGFIESRGRIHYFDCGNIRKEINSTQVTDCIKANMSNFLYSHNTFSGMRALGYFDKNVDNMLNETDAIKRKRSFGLFHYFCIAGGGGSFLRRNYLRFLRKIETYYPKTDQLLKAQNIYKDLHHMWKDLGKLFYQCSTLEEDQNNQSLFDEIKAKFRAIIMNEKAGAELLLSFANGNTTLSEIVKQISDFNWDFSILSCAKYLQQRRLDYELKSTNIVSDIDRDQHQYPDTAAILIVDFDSKRLVPYKEWNKTYSDAQQIYFYYIVYRLEVGNLCCY